MLVCLEMNSDTPFNTIFSLAKRDIPLNILACNCYLDQQASFATRSSVLFLYLLERQEKALRSATLYSTTLYRFTSLNI